MRPVQPPILCTIKIPETLVHLLYKFVVLNKENNYLTKFILTTIITKYNKNIIQCHNDVRISPNPLQNKYVKYVCDVTVIIIMQ